MKMMSGNFNNLRVTFVLLTITLVAESYLIFIIQRDGRDNENWAGPYYSAAANLHFGGSFSIDLQDVNTFKELSPEDQYKYHFKKSENTTEYRLNPIGFAYIIFIAKSIFFFAGNASAVVIFQVIMHLLLCFYLILQVNRKSFTIIFSLLYILNPLVINFVVLNYYYFWQCVPGFVILYMLAGTKKSEWQPWIFTLFLTIATLARPTILFISAFTFLLYFFYYSRWLSIANICIATGLILLINQPTDKNIWHTIYVGIAAYPNEFVQQLSDNEGYALYKQQRGVELNASAGGNYYEKDIIDDYREVTKNEVERIFKQNPVLFIRNAFLNTMQSFSCGYFNGNGLVLNLISALAGLIFIILLWMTGQRIILFSIFLYAFTFCFYYPPIQAYLFGAFILSAVGLYSILTYYFPNKFQPIFLHLPRIRTVK